MVSYFDIINTALNKKGVKIEKKYGTRRVPIDSGPTPTEAYGPEIVKDSSGKPSNFQYNYGYANSITSAFNSTSGLSLSVTISTNGINFIKGHELFRAQPYNNTLETGKKDNAEGYGTIGYGTTWYPDTGRKVKMSDPAISREKAEEYLKIYCKKVCEDRIKKAFPGLQFFQNEIDAMHSYIYNSGSFTPQLQWAIKQYKGAPTISRGNLQTVWENTRISRAPTLLKARRIQEVNMFLSSIYEYPKASEQNVGEQQYREERYEIPGEFVTKVDSDKMFSNFKVDDDIFNFFLKKNQFDKKYRI